MEAALLAQEQLLEEARLLRARREDPSDAKPGSSPSRRDAAVDDNAGIEVLDTPAIDGVSERFRSLRHAVDARSLQWRLQLEKWRAESLSVELELRKGYTQE